MNNDLINLIKIAQIDKEASTKEPEINKIEEELNIKLRELEEIESSLDDVRDNIKKAKLSISNNELIIEENNEKITQIDQKMASAKSEREIRALDAENGLAKEKITFANESINNLEKEIIKLSEKEKGQESNIEEIKKEIEEIKTSVEERTAIIRNELNTILASKDNIIENIDNKIIAFYEKIRKWAKDTSVVPVKKQACSGCFIKINDRIFMELKNADSIITCPHCGRILYIEQEAS